MDYNNTYRSLTQKAPKTRLVSSNELEEFKELIQFFYKHTNSSIKLNTTEGNYICVALEASSSKKNTDISPRFICDLYNGYSLTTRKRKIKTLSDTFDYLRVFKSAKENTSTPPHANKNHVEQEILDEAKALQNHYEQDEIDVGVVKANKAYDKYDSHPQILKHVFRFNMRKKEWEWIRTIVEKVLKESPSEMLQTQCYLTLFECELREANSIFMSDRTERSKKILYGKKFLNQVPQSHHDYEQYLYWNGKWYLELWHSTNGDDFSNLKEAQSFFEKALRKKYTWWYHCYKCIILKLLDNEIFSEEVKKFTECIIKEMELQPNRPAVRTYRITSFVLNDDMNGLRIFLKENNSPTSATDFLSTIFHHIKLIFYKDQTKQNIYKNVLESWVANLPLK